MENKNMDAYDLKVLIKQAKKRFSISCRKNHKHGC